MRKFKRAFGALLAVALPLCGAAADVDSYVYWMVDQDPASGVLFDLARMVATPAGASSGETLQIRGKDGDADFAPSLADKMSTDQLSGILSAGMDYTGYTFVIELFAFTDDQGSDIRSVAQSQIYTFADFYGHIYDPSKPTQAASTLSVSAFTIPEPTGALMMLFGLAALGLRRRNLNEEMI